MDKIQNALLGLSALDYESVQSISGQLTEELGYEPTDGQIKESLISLNGNGYINFYLYNESSRTFICQKSFSEPIANLWFMATTSGKEE